MNQTLKTILAIIGIIALVVVGYVVGRGLLQDDYQGIVKELTFSVVVLVPGDFEIDMGPKNEFGEVEVAVKKGEPAVFTITNTVSGGFDVKIQYDISGLPDGSYSFSANPVNPGEATTLTVDTSLLTSNSAYVCSLTASDYIPPQE